MSTYERKPEHMRAPDHLSKEQIEQSLDELNSKIKTRQAKVNATTADSKHHFHEHIAALQAKRDKIAQLMEDPSQQTPKGWVQVNDTINDLKKDVDKYFD
ncbi:MAG: hypothetical protein LPK19_04370 [Hymenobacteraceae bacterium]|nr:hypothetical protein [Hymenobacteraceae bacterium]MDX5395431.1 hypothetical protein [Hymenobacteraceae bacterium]MDX5511480.1 hypothetical protein [Hymenobacteraceae bacterium]